MLCYVLLKIRDYGVCEKWLLGAKGVKITIEQQKKVPKGVQNQKISYISAN